MDQERDVLKEAQERVLALRQSGASVAAPEEPEPLEEKEKKKKKKLLLLLLLLLLLIVSSVLIFVLDIRPWQRNNPFEMGFIIGAGTEGLLPGRTAEEIIEALQREADENLISFRINARPVFANGTSTGTLQIENPPYNLHFFRADIYLLNALGGLSDLIYTTNMLAPNHHIDRDRLMVELPPGEHRAVAELTFYHFETFEEISVQQAELIITIGG
ncbi:MAG: hypothetical protein FWD82_05260 [Defluviitaleaceae bacterium]|nr:hypothetical protein [Defluviitaleaceae bacterium]